MTQYLPRSEFECTRKLRYATPEGAKAGERAARRRGAEWLHTYRCWFCDGWHVGHITNWKTLAALARANGKASNRR